MSLITLQTCTVLACFAKEVGYFCVEIIFLKRHRRYREVASNDARNASYQFLSTHIFFSNAVPPYDFLLRIASSRHNAAAPCKRSTLIPCPASRSSFPRSFFFFFRIASTIATSERCQLCCNICPSFSFASESSKLLLSLIIFAQAGLAKG